MTPFVANKREENGFTVGWRMTRLVNGTLYRMDVYANRNQALRARRGYAQRLRYARQDLRAFITKEERP